MPLSVLSSDSMQIGILATAAHAATNQSPFTIFYNPRTSLSEFVFPSAKYNKSLYDTQVSIGMHFRMMFESEESSVCRAGVDDKPLRMVKTVLHELVKIHGTTIKGHLSMVPIDVEPQPIILAYIDLNLQTLAAARMLAPSGIGQAQWGDFGANSAPTQQSTEAQLKVDIFSQLQNASEAFRIYIRDGLAQMVKNAAAGRTPSSVPISTPPPMSSALSSPKCGPPSPIKTKLQSVRIDNTMPNIQSLHESNDASGGTMPSTMDTIESRKPSQIRSRKDQDEDKDNS